MKHIIIRFAVFFVYSGMFFCENLKRSIYAG